MKVRFFRSASVEGSGGPAPSSPAEGGGGMDHISTDIQSVFEYDPFEPPATPAPEPAPAAAASPEPPPAEPTPVTPSVATPAPEPLAEAAAALRDAAQALPQAVREATAPARPAAPEADPWTPMVDGQALDYRQVFQQIPDSMLAGIRSENPVEQKAAIGSLLAVSATLAHRLAFKQATETVRNELAQALPTYVQSTLRSHREQEQVFQDFYSKYPQLSHPSIRPVVLTAAKELAAQTGVRGWTPQFRDQLGEHVLNMLRGVASPAAPPAAAPASQMSGASVRPASRPTTQSDEFSELLF